MRVWQVYEHSNANTFVGFVDGEFTQLSETPAEYGLSGVADSMFDQYCRDPNARDSYIHLILARNQDQKMFMGEFLAESKQAHTSHIVLKSNGDVPPI